MNWECGCTVHWPAFGERTKDVMLEKVTVKAPVPESPVSRLVICHAMIQQYDGMNLRQFGKQASHTKS